MEIKFVIFFFALFFGVPAWAAVARSYPKIRRATMFLMIVTTPFIYSTGINFITDMYYRGSARGMEIIGADLVTLSLLMAMVVSPQVRLRWCPPGSFFYFFYFGTCVLSLMNAASLIYGVFELWKMCVMFLYFVTFYNYVMLTRDITVVLNALATMIIFSAFYMAFQRYGSGVYQPSGIFPHRNAAAMFANCAAPIFFAAVLNAKLSRAHFWAYFAAFGACAVIVILSLSRGAIFFFPWAALIVVVGSLFKGFNARKMRVLTFIGVLGTAVIINAAPTIVERFERAPRESGVGRIHLARAALNMANAEFFGVGVNNWGVKINPPYPYCEGTGMDRPEGYKAGLVETIYLLVAAECGWIGLLALLSWFGYIYLGAFRCIFRYAKTGLFFLPLGILAGLSAIFGQSVLEWGLKQPINFYQVMMMFALVSALNTVWRAHKNPQRRAA